MDTGGILVPSCTFSKIPSARFFFLPPDAPIPEGGGGGEKERNLSGKASFQPVTRMDRLPSVRSLYRGLLISNDLLGKQPAAFRSRKKKKERDSLLRSSIDVPPPVYRNPLHETRGSPPCLFPSLFNRHGDVRLVRFSFVSISFHDEMKSEGSADAALSSRDISSTTVYDAGNNVRCKSDAYPLFLSSSLSSPSTRWSWPLCAFSFSFLLPLRISDRRLGRAQYYILII